MGKKTSSQPEKNRRTKGGVKKKTNGEKKTPGKKKTPKDQPTYAELRAWLATVRSRNFSRAAKHLDCSPATVQLLVRSLGEKVQAILGPDAKLFTYDSAARTIEPTEHVGRKLFEWADSHISEVEHATQYIREFLTTKSNSLRVAAADAVWQSRLLSAVAKVQKKKYDDLELRMYARPTARSLEKLRVHDCQIAFVSAIAFDAEEFPERVRFEEFYRFPVELLVPASWKLATDESFRNLLARARHNDHEARREVLDTILRAPSLILPGEFAVFRRHVDDVFRAHGLPRKGCATQEFDTGASIVRAVANGLGAAIQQSCVADAAFSYEPGEIHQPNCLRRIPLHGVFHDWVVLGVWDPLYMTAPAKEFLDICRQLSRDGDKHE